MCDFFPFSRAMHCVREYVTSVTSDKVALEAREKLFTNILKQEVGFFDMTKSNKILRGLYSDEIGEVWNHVDRIVSNVCEMSMYFSIFLTKNATEP